jgi:hypothetical protein
MTPTVRAVLIAIVAVAVVSGMVAAVRRAKRGGSSAAVAGTAMLFLGSIFAGRPPPDHYIENMRENKGKKDNESGGPPATGV